MGVPWDELRLQQVEAGASECPDACAADVVSLVKLVREYRSLLDSAEYELDWLTLHHVIEDGGKDWTSKFDGSAFYDCDCSESGGYMDYDVNAYEHAEQCASGHEDSLAALHDQIRQALGKR